MITFSDYVCYSTLNSREDVEAWIKDGNSVYSNNENYLSIVEHLLKHKDQNKRNYRPRGSKQSYNNIYAHRILVMLPKNMNECEISKFVQTYMCAVDSLYRNSKFLYLYKAYTQGKGQYADIVCFTRKFYKKKQKKLIVWDQNYYWNPKTKRRSIKEDPDAVLLHKKGDPKLSSEGKKQYAEYYISLKEEQIFKYKSFKRFTSRLKKAVKYTRQLIFRDFYNEQIKYFSYLTVLKKFTVLKKRKIEIKNSLIQRINMRIYEYQKSLLNGYFYSDVEKEFHKLIYKIDKLLHSSSFKDATTKNNIYLGNRQSFASLNENIDLLEEYISTLLDNWWENQIYIPYLQEVSSSKLN